MISPNIKKYEIIWQAKQKDPNVVLSSLCDKYKVSYQSYNNWVKRHKKAPVLIAEAQPEPPKPSPDIVKDNPKDVVNVAIPLSIIIKAVRYHKKEIVIPRDRVLNALSPQDKARVATAIGMLALEHGPAESTDGLAADDGELNASKRNPFDAKG